jgi:hypothetical protein
MFLGSVYDTTTRCFIVFLVGAAVSERRKIGSATSLHCIERDNYTDKRYVY